MKVNLAYQQPFSVEVLLIDGLFVGSEIYVALNSGDFRAHILPTTQYCKDCDPLALYLKNNFPLSNRGCDDGNVEIAISLKSTDKKFVVRLEGDPLEKLYKLFGEKVWLKIEISDVYLDGRHLTALASRKMNVQVEDEDYYAVGLMQCPTDWRKLWLSRSEGLTFTGKINLQVCTEKVGPTQNAENGELLAINKMLLHSQLATDVQVVCGTGSTPVVACHKSFLLAHSAKFAITNNIRGWTTVTFEDTSEAGVKALLKYLYYRDLEDPKTNPCIAAELQRCSVKYQIESLEKAMKELKP